MEWVAMSEQLHACLTLQYQLQCQASDRATLSSLEYNELITPPALLGLDAMVQMWPRLCSYSLPLTAPSTRQLCALNWHLFVSWCSQSRLDPVDYLVGSVL